MYRGTKDVNRVANKLAKKNRSAEAHLEICASALAALEEEIKKKFGEDWLNACKQEKEFKRKVLIMSEHANLENPYDLVKPNGEGSRNAGLHGTECPSRSYNGGARTRPSEESTNRTRRARTHWRYRGRDYATRDKVSKSLAKDRYSSPYTQSTTSSFD